MFARRHIPAYFACFVVVSQHSCIIGQPCWRCGGSSGRKGRSAAVENDHAFPTAPSPTPVPVVAGVDHDRAELEDRLQRALL